MQNAECKMQNAEFLDEIKAHPYQPLLALTRP